jgi:hypothetical protein
MKKILLLVFAVGLFSCSKEKSNETSSSIAQGCTVWADSISAQSPVMIQDGWSEADWAKENKYNTAKIFNTIKDAVLTGKLKAYDVYDNNEIPMEEFKMILERTDTVEQADEQKPENIRQLILKTELKAEDIARIDTKEKWYFDETAFKLKKEVESITFLKNSYTESGEIRGVAAVFMVKLNN